MRAVKLVATLTCCVVVFALLNSPIGELPPLGRFLNPFAGFWTNSRAQDALPVSTRLPGLLDEVEIKWDQRRVPHIIAQNLHDVFFAQGYIVARDRLWQMDFQVRAAAGRLAEIVGPKAIEADRFRRRIGLALAAERSTERIMADPESRLAAQAFADGVNAWIMSLSPSRLPVEYKILDYAPEPWSPLSSALLLKSMAYTLTFRSSELAMTQSAEVLDHELMDLLYPLVPPFVEPEIAEGTRWMFKPLDVHAATRGHAQTTRRTSAPGAKDTREKPTDDRWAGSNAWAIAGAKTSSGFPILCNDPHMSLTLPSIWYEIQLMAPGLNVYGVTTPGAPGVLIGFNRYLAWGSTNAQSDVLDWYAVTFRDSTQREVLRGEAWEPVMKRVEAIRVRGGATVFDTVVSTRQGPIVVREGEPRINSTIPVNAALRWTAREASNELLAYLKINEAANSRALLDALRSIDCPGLNFVYAIRSDTIGLIHAGKFPVRRRGQGRMVSNGADPADDWGPWIPREQLPQVVNPACGFVSSANQPPAGARYPYYLGSEYASFERSARINDVLTRLEKITPEMMIYLQNDTYSEQAHLLLPVLLPIVQEGNVDEAERSLVEELEKWNYEYQRELSAPTIYDAWWKELDRAIWLDDVHHDTVTLRWPRRDVTTAMILDGSIRRFADDRSTTQREQWEDVVRASFHRAAVSLIGRLGPLDERWQWGDVRESTIPHLANIPGLGRSSLRTNGSAYVINATTASFGPTWRMVVELGPEIRAWGIYPGGQSGNPGSEHYDGAVSDWVRGFTYELVFLQSPADTLRYSLQRTYLERKP